MNRYIKAKTVWMVYFIAAFLGWTLLLIGIISLIFTNTLGDYISTKQYELDPTVASAEGKSSPFAVWAMPRVMGNFFNNIDVRIRFSILGFGACLLLFSLFMRIKYSKEIEHFRTML